MKEGEGEYQRLRLASFDHVIYSIHPHGENDAVAKGMLSQHVCAMVPGPTISMAWSCHPFCMVLAILVFVFTSCDQLFFVVRLILGLARSSSKCAPFPSE